MRQPSRFKFYVTALILSSCLTSVAEEKASTVAAPPCGDSASSKFDISKGFSVIAEKTVKAVVNVSTTQVVEAPKAGPGERGLPQLPPGSPFEEFFREFFDQMEKPRKVQSLGSGFIIKVTDSTAFIVTNYHVIADAKKINIFLHDNTELEATVHGLDERTDIAVLKVKLDSLTAEQRKLDILEWGNSNTVKVGDWVLAIGNPFGLGSTVTSGIISNRSRDIGVARTNGGKHRVSDYVDDFLQHDAAINMGNSGGPLLDLDGKVVGINAAILSPSGGSIGIGFSIPAAVAKETVDQLIEFGRTKRGWLGVRIQNVTDEIAESLGLGKAKGAIVGSVTPNGPAAKAGIQAGDVILEFDGREINEKSRLARVVGETTVGKTVKVKLWRKGKEVTVDVLLGEFETSQDKPDHPAAEKPKAAVQEGVEVLGIRLSQVTPELMEKYKLPKDSKGLVVVSVSSESPAAEIGLRPGDVIAEATQKELSKPEDFAKAVETAKSEKRKNILLLVIRDGEPRFVPLKLESDESKPVETKEKEKEKEKAEKRP